MKQDSSPSLEKLSSGVITIFHGTLPNESMQLREKVMARFDSVPNAARCGLSEGQEIERS